MHDIKYTLVVSLSIALSTFSVLLTENKSLNNSILAFYVIKYFLHRYQILYNYLGYLFFLITNKR